MSGLCTASAADRPRRRAHCGALVPRVAMLLAALGLLSLVLAAAIVSPAAASGPKVLEEFPICIVGGDQWSPVVAGDYIVWEDTRNGSYDIYGYNRATKQELTVYVGSGDQCWPAISRGVVVWQDNRNGTTNDDIYGYDLINHRSYAVCTEDGGQWHPAISGNTVVWQDMREPGDNIYGYDLTTKREFPICTAFSYQQYPAISGKTVVWEDYRNGDSDIYGYDLSTKSEFPICIDSGDQCAPAISGRTVVWEDSSAGDGDIYGCNLDTRATFAICIAGGDQYYPQISGQTVVWHDWRTGVADINGYDLTTGSEFPVCIHAGAQVGPGISGNTVVWADRRDLVDYDIYGATLADVMSGYVYDGHSAKTLLGNAVQDAKVEVREAGSDDVLDSDYTDKEGMFSLSFDFESGTTYRATATLESKDKLLVMQRDGQTVSFSRDFTDLSPEDFGLQIDCSQVAKIAAASMAKGDIENCASVWHYLQLNRQVAKAVGRDLAETLTVHVFTADQQGFYDADENVIRLGAHKMDDDTHAPADADPPPWDFRKNRESHEFGHAMMDLLMDGEWVALADVANHAGYINSNTGDSLCEGFAEYWAMFADEMAGISEEPDRYDQWGYLATMNRRMAWSPVDPAIPMAVPTTYPREAHAVAGLLRILEVALGGGAAGFGKIAASLPADGNLTDLRNNLVAAGAAAATIDPLFFSFGFFADANGNWTRDAGEEVGAGNGTPCKMMYKGAAGQVTLTVPARPERHDHPFDPNSFVVVNLSGVTGSRSESWVTVAVRHADPAADFSDRVLVTGPSGLLFVCLDETATGVLLTARGGDGVLSADKLSFTAAEWAAAQAAAVDDVVTSRTFRVCRVTVGNPVAPRTMSRLKASTVTATLKPRHAAGTYPLRIYKYRYLAGQWKSYGYVKAKAANYSTFTKCSCKVKLPYAGRWRLRAYAPADSLHKARWSRGYDYVTVR